MKWGDFASGWRVLQSRIVGVGPTGHTIEVIARAPAQVVSRAHIFTFRVEGHSTPADDLEAATDLVVEAQPSPLPSIAWVPVPRAKGVTR